MWNSEQAMEVVAKIKNGERAVSSSALKNAKTSFRDFLNYYLKPKETKSYFDFGNALELFLIDKTEFYKQVVIMDESKRPEPTKDYRTKVNQEWKADFYRENEGKYIIPVSGDESFETITILESLAKEHPLYDALISGDYQTAFEWKCPVTSVRRYARPDIILNGDVKVIIDIKTDAGEDFVRSAVNSDHFLQAYDQIQGAILSGTMERVDEYYWAVFEKKAPYHVTFYQFDLENLLPIEEFYSKLLYYLKLDLEAGIVPSFRGVPVKKIQVPNYYNKN
jgi:hypothetical protein